MPPFLNNFGPDWLSYHVTGFEHSYFRQTIAIPLFNEKSAGSGGYKSTFNLNGTSQQKRLTCFYPGDVCLVFGLVKLITGQFNSSIISILYVFIRILGIYT